MKKSIRLFKNVPFIVRILLNMVLLFSTFNAYAQEVCDTIYINMPDGKVVKYNVENVDSITFTPHNKDNNSTQLGGAVNQSAAISWIDDDFLVDRYPIYYDLHDWCIEKDIRLDFAYIPRDRALATAQLWEEEGFTFVMHPSHGGWYTDSNYTHDIKTARSSLIKCMRDFQKNIASSRRTVLVYPGSSDFYQDNIDYVKNYVECGISATNIGTNSGNTINRYSIKRFSLWIRNGYSKTRLKELIKQAVDRGDWIILYTHIYNYENTDVVDETTNSKANLLEIVEYANSLCPIRPTEAIWQERKKMYGF